MSRQPDVTPPTASTSDGPSLAVSLDCIDDLASLQAEWRLLEQASRPSFFQSWDWVGTLLETLPIAARPRILRVRMAQRVVGLALLASSTRQRRGVIRTRAWQLNETGVPEFDALTVEHNDLLVHAGMEDAALDAVVAHLGRLRGWDELYLAGLTANRYAAWSGAAARSGLWCLARWFKPWHCVDLDAIRNGGGTHLESLSANTRYQIRRAMRLYAARGSLALRHAGSLREAQSWLSGLCELHQAYWQAQGHPGAFATAVAQRFHAALVSRAWPHGVEIVRVSAGDDTVGYLYNFRKDGTIYNYQSGFRYESDPRLKPGMVCHSLAIDDALHRGLATYDLLAGGGGYKASLGNVEREMVWAVVQQPRLLIGVENALRGVKERWRGSTRSEPPRRGLTASEASQPTPSVRCSTGRE